MRRGITLLQAQHWSSTLTVLAAFFACAVSGELGPALLVGFPLALIGAEVLGSRVQGKADWLWTTLLALLLVLFTVQVFSGALDIVLAAARFAILLCIHRLWHRRTQRDELLLLLLSLLLLCGGAALSAEILFGLAFLAYAVAGTWALALLHLRSAIEAGRGPQGSAALLHSRRLATPGLLGGLAGLSLLGIVGAAVVFVAFPRVNIGRFKRSTRPSPIAGLSDRVELSGHGVVANDPRIVLRVRLHPDPEESLLRMHWRARALEIWTGAGWRARDDSAAVLSPGALPGRPDGDGRWREVPVDADIETVAGFAEGVVLTPGGWPHHVWFKAPVSTRPVQQRLYRNDAGDLFYQPVTIGDLRYVANVDVSTPPPAGLRNRGRAYPESVAVDLRLPEDLDPRIGALSRRLTDGKDPADAAAAVERWLTTSLTYTRELAGEQRDPVAHFLFERKQGHCELFSSAMVLLLRAAGIAARNVTGYYGGERTPMGYYAVRAGSAHSWVEVYFPGVGFVTYDPTPPSERGGPQDDVWAKAVLLWDALSQRWRAFIVDYDLLAQEQFVKKAAALFQDVGKRLSGKGGRSEAFKTGMTVLAALALLALAIAGIRRARLGRAGRLRIRLGEDQLRARRLWRKARTRLARSGLQVGPSTTPRDAAAIVPERASPALRRLADAWASARWGQVELSAEASRKLLADVEAALREHR